mmetsp:Transcript_9339/g.23604  ORF Transcript_9339/g.23604 Transcript_9339/m.23604 type:complete len:207 (+) Transcript_9339:1796-2416(+)
MPSHSGGACACTADACPPLPHPLRYDRELHGTAGGGWVLCGLAHLLEQRHTVLASMGRRRADRNDPRFAVRIHRSGSSARWAGVRPHLLLADTPPSSLSSLAGGRSIHQHQRVSWHCCERARASLGSSTSQSRCGGPYGDAELDAGNQDRRGLVRVRARIGLSLRQGVDASVFRAQDPRVWLRGLPRRIPGLWEPCRSSRHTKVVC